MDQFEYMGEMAFRLHSDCLVQLKKSLKEEKIDKIRIKKSTIIQEIKSILELYKNFSI